MLNADLFEGLRKGDDVIVVFRDNSRIAVEYVASNENTAFAVDGSNSLMIPLYSVKYVSKALAGQ